MGMDTLLDLVKKNGNDALVGLIDETTKVHPELSLIPVRTIKGTHYNTLVRTALGATTPGFRNANAGVAPVKNSYVQRMVQCFILEAVWQADKAIADGYEDGANAYVAMEAGGIMEGQMQGLSSQFYYGTDATYGNAAGFPGLLQAYDTTNMVVDAGGTTAGTGSSVWFVRTGPQDVTWAWGNTGQISVFPDLASAIANPVRVVDANDATKSFQAYQQTLSGRPGLQVGATRAVCRIKKLTEDSGKGLTDDLIFQALSKFPAGRGPNRCFMTQRSLMQLMRSRVSSTATAIGGIGLAAYPTTIKGVDGQDIPISVTDAILNTEPLTL